MAFFYAASVCTGSGARAHGLPRDGESIALQSAGTGRRGHSTVARIFALSFNSTASTRNRGWPEMSSATKLPIERKMQPSCIVQPFRAITGTAIHQSGKDRSSGGSQ